MPKKRVNITIDEDIHSETKKRLDSIDMDFSNMIEQICLEFLAATEDMFKRAERARQFNEQVTPTEVRLLLLQAMGQVQVKAGVGSAKIIEQLATIEAELAQPKLLKNEVIHTEAPKKVTKKIAKK